MAWRALTALPIATEAMVRGVDAMATAAGALVLVTSLIPVFAVCMVALGVRDANRRLSRRGSGSG